MIRDVMRINPLQQGAVAPTSYIFQAHSRNRPLPPLELDAIRGHSEECLGKEVIVTLY